MTQTTQENTEVGNTKSTSTKVRNWCFTLNNYEAKDIDTIIGYDCKYTFQEETGKNGTKHLQGVLSFSNARSFESMKKLNEKCHWEPCRNLKNARNYCSKKDTRTGKLYSTLGDEPEQEIEDEWLNLKAHKWQEDILNIIKEKPDSRKIYWYWDKKGGGGKTTFAKHLVLKYDGTIYVSGKATDIKYAIAQYVVEKKKKLKLCIFDFTRSLEGYVSYESIEAIKNGIFFSGKYEGDMVIFNKPHIIIFSNFPPETEKLSEDRWNIININEN